MALYACEGKGKKCFSRIPISVYVSLEEMRFTIFMMFMVSKMGESIRSQDERNSNIEIESTQSFAV